MMQNKMWINYFIIFGWIGKCLGCGGIITDMSGSIESPGYPDDYDKGQNCVWTIQVPDNYTIRLKFEDFAIESKSQCVGTCSCDFVRLKDLQTLDKKTYCGFNIPKDFISAGNEITVTFKSDTMKEFRGFNATFTAIPKCPLYLGNTSGTFETFDHPSKYLIWRDCSWIITVPDGYTIRLTFEAFEIEPADVHCNGYCSCDYVVVKDPRAATEQKYCGSTIPPDFQSTGTTITVQFVSDGLREYEGFKASYTSSNLDDCVANMCLHGGTCVDGINSYACDCTAGYEGEHCEIDKAECSSNPCLHGGMCVDGVNQYQCVCTPGYEGVTCELNKAECSSNPCLNGGTCVDGVNRYQCVCIPGYEGVNCEFNKAECSSNPCLNGGMCVDGVNQYQCACTPGYEGVNCEFNVDECSSNPCMNGGSCFDYVDRYHCVCISGYEGVNCEFNKNECLSDPCLNGGTCVDGVNTYRCDCFPVYTGVHCESDAVSGTRMKSRMLGKCMKCLTPNSITTTKAPKEAPKPDRRKWSKYQRTLSCAPDERPSSRAIGGSTIFIITSIFAVFIVSDLMRFIQYWIGYKKQQETRTTPETQK